MADTPRSALITGASRGIGRAIALRLSAAGHRVAVNYNSHREDADKVVKEIREAGGAAIAVPGSVSEKSAVEAMISEAEEAHGPIEIMVNNAGIISDSLLMRMKDESFDRVIDTNLRGTYLCTRLVTPGMIKNRWGRIINITSVVGMRGNAGQTNYSASKAAIHGFTKSLAKELATRNITVNAIAPGYVTTATVDGLSEKVKETIMTWIPMGRFGEPDEIAPMAAFLASDDARYITGDVIRVDGGMAI
ncbi:MAG: 3-oxoacyl-[acyl-carrier-protein] reductase [Dehalococcoidia bacterium]